MGNIKALVTAELLEKNDDNLELQLTDNVVVDLYDSNYHHTSTIKSDYAFVSEKENRINAFGNVIVKADEGEELLTDSLLWNNKVYKIFTDSELIFISGDLDTLYGSWAGAYGNFQFMPSSIQNYAIDYDKNGKIELKLLNDSIASAANYINEIGWNKNGYCFLKIQMPTNLPDMYLNSSAKNIINHQTIKQWKNYNILKNTDISDNLTAALIIPDGDLQSPTYLVFDNYEKILKWNRSLRFALSVCSLANMIRNEI